MSAPELVLGLDSSTQSLSAVVIDTATGSMVMEASLAYRNDERLRGYGFEHDTMVIPPREPGEADQPPRLFLASLEALLGDMQARGLDFSRVKAVNVSGQQHGHVYLGSGAKAAFAALGDASRSSESLVDLLGACFSYGTSPIWKTSNTAKEADALRKAAGGRDAMIGLSGSDSPLRFTGAVMRRVGSQFPASWEATETVQLISSFIPAVLAGNPRTPWDFGNGSGTSLMDYGKKTWAPALMAGCAAGLPGATAALEAKLPGMVHPLAKVGTVAAWFQARFGFAADCAVIAGSGDNPQTKVLIDGDLLSLGTSFVMMASTEPGTVDMQGYANAMYDGLGRSFCFGCRTNGALVWDRVRTRHGKSTTDFASCDAALSSVAPATVMRFWQPDAESFPSGKAFDLTRKDSQPADFAHDYAGVVDSALALLWHYSQGFAPSGKGKTLYIAGGPTANKYILQRVAAIWNCPVVVIGRAGAALGTAVAAGAALLPEAARNAWVGQTCAALIGGSAPVLPDPALVKAYHESGWISRLVKEFESIAGLA